MSLIEISAKKLMKISKKKKIICFGAGDRLIQIFEAFPDLKIEKNVFCILDNDSKKWGNYRILNNERIEIKSPELLKNIDISEYTILITTFRYNEVFAQIQNYTGDVNVKCIKNVPYRIQIGIFFEKILRKLPLRNTIVLQGEGDTCENAVAFSRYLMNDKEYVKYKIYWLCDHPERFSSTKNEKYIKRNSNLENVSVIDLFTYVNALNRSKFLIFENKMIKKQRDNQISVYLNHGSPPIKATKGKINLANDLNYAICPSEYCTDILCEQYSINKERLLYCGSPRTDILYKKEIREEINRLFDKTQYKKVILWVPTFRQHNKNGRIDSNRKFKCGIPIIEEDSDWRLLIETLEKNKVLLIIKPHLLQDLTKLSIQENKWIKFIKQDKLERYGLNVYDLMKCCDAMITDYSTIGFDYMLLDRPIGYTIDDMEEYDIGFSVENPFELMAGKKIKTLYDYLSFIENIKDDIDEYKVERNCLNKKIHGNFADGNNAGRLTKLLGL